jgi:hypothetical protein
MNPRETSPEEMLDQLIGEKAAVSGTGFNKKARARADWQVAMTFRR